MTVNYYFNGICFMDRFFIYILLFSFATATLSACNDKEVAEQKKVERPIEYDQFGNPVIYTADGEKELIDEDCD
jgi:hypothetical protein